MESSTFRRARWVSPVTPAAAALAQTASAPVEGTTSARIDDGAALEPPATRRRRRSADSRERGIAHGQSPYEASYDIAHGYGIDRSITLP